MEGMFCVDGFGDLRDPVVVPRQPGGINRHWAKWISDNIAERLCLSRTQRIPGCVIHSSQILTLLGTILCFERGLFGHRSGGKPSGVTRTFAADQDHPAIPCETVRSNPNLRGFIHLLEADLAVGVSFHDPHRLLVVPVLWDADLPTTGDGEQE